MTITPSVTPKTPVMTRCLLSVAVASALLLSACGSDNDDNNNASVVNPSLPVVTTATSKPIRSFTRDQVNSSLVPATAAAATPAAKCGVTIEKVTYDTKGAAGEATKATAALMLPNGDDASCKGNRPVLLYAHGTTTDKGYDFSQVGNPGNPGGGEATLIAANFAAQGYIVVAPNYAGYDESTLAYHPYLVAEQQSTDMVDALASSRAIINEQKRANNVNYSKLNDSGKLFISGYSQGGHVAMATARRLEALQQPITAIAPLSGPYALAAFGDAIFAGNVNIGATRFAPLLATGLKQKYGNIYGSATEIFSDQYAATQLPSNLTFAQLVAAGQLPENALFQSKPTSNPLINQLPDSKLPFAPIGFDPTNFLIKTDFRAAYVADALQNPDDLIAMTGAFPAANPQNNLRKALKDNDLRGYIPNTPTLLCGGNQDPTVFFDLNTSSMAAIIDQVSKAIGANLNVTVLDVDVTNASTRNKPTVTTIGSAAMSNPWLLSPAIGNVQTRFTSRLIATATSAGSPQAGQAAVIANYHGNLVTNACTQATREFFEQNFNNVQQLPI